MRPSEEHSQTEPCEMRIPRRPPQPHRSTDDMFDRMNENFARYRDTHRYGSVRQHIANGLIVSNGELWNGQRQMVQLAFSKESIAGSASVIGADLQRL